MGETSSAPRTAHRQLPVRAPGEKVGRRTNVGVCPGTEGVSLKQSASNGGGVDSNPVMNISILARGQRSQEE